MASDAVNSLLDKIPGYGGYRDLDRRRESDRLIREALARDFQSIADRLGRVAKKLAEDRAVAAIQHVDQPHQRLTHLISRLRTASYGYAPLFSDRPVEAGALDQIAEFDRSLADQLIPLSEQVGKLERADPTDPSFRELAVDVTAIVDGLHERFERRNEVIESGEPQPEESVRALLAPPPSGSTPTAYNLHDGEAVTYSGVNYIVRGRITILSDQPKWRDFQLMTGDSHRWLRVPANSEDGFWWLEEVETPASLDEQSVTVNEASFAVSDRFAGRAEVIGVGGKSEARRVDVTLARNHATGKLLCVYDWGAEQFVLAGDSIDPAELELWSREGGSAI